MPQPPASALWAVPSRGNAIEGRNNSQDYNQGYRVSVQLDHGGYRVYDVSSPGDLRIGDRVRLYNGQISRL